MRWIDGQGYAGPDRRNRRAGLRMLDRRKDDYAGRPPALPTAIRQLRLRVMEAGTPDGRKQFSARTKSVLVLAEHYRNRAVCDIVRGMIRKLDAPAAGDIRAWLEAELSRAALAAG